MVNWYGDDLYEIAPDGSAILRQVPLGNSLWQLVVAPDGQEIYLTDRSADLVRVIDQATLTSAALAAEAVGHLSTAQNQANLQLQANLDYDLGELSKLLDQQRRAVLLASAHVDEVGNEHYHDGPTLCLLDQKLERVHI